MSAISASGGPMLAALQQRFQGSGGGGLAALQQQFAPQAQAKLQSFAESAGIDPSQFTDIRDQIQTTVSDVQASGGDEAAVKDAVRGVLEDNGVDTEKLKSEMQSFMSESGFSPPSGGIFGGGNFGGGFQFNGVGSQSDALSSLFGESDSSESDELSLLQMLSQMPKGSVINSFA